MPKQIVDEYVRLGLSSVFLRALSPFGFAVKTGAASSYHVEEWLEFYRRGLQHILGLNRAGCAIREEYASLLLRKMLTPWPTTYVDLQSPAGIGITCLAYNYDGGVYASDEARMLAEMRDETFRLGHLESHSYAECVSSLIETLAATMTDVMPMCADCGVQPWCGSDPVFHHATQRDVVRRKPASAFCRRNMEIIRHLVRSLEDDPESAEVLRPWIS
jgi:sulfatase maturation enzyme AslB (radical SAM superfamily)